MSGLDGGAPVAGGEGAAPTTGAAPSSDQSFADRLESRIEARREAAERGPDGKFLPKGVPAPVALADDTNEEPKEGEEVEAAEPDAEKAPKESAELAKAKAEHERVLNIARSLKERDNQWTDVAERALARIDTLEAHIARAEEMLSQHGLSLDPTSIENLRLQEQLHAIDLAKERTAAEQQRQQQLQMQRQKQQAQRNLEETTRNALKSAPNLVRNGPELRQYLEAVWKGGDPVSLARYFEHQATQATQNRPQPAPRTLSGRTSGSGNAQKVLSPDDIADKWKQMLPAHMR